jgi:hypothetical protein
VGDDDASRDDFRSYLRQDRGDVLVRQPVESVALHAGIADLLGQRDQLGHGRLAAMKAGVEAGDLRYAGQALLDRFDRRQIVRLMERRQGDEGPQLLQHLGGDDGRPCEAGPSVDDTMAHADHPRSAIARAQPG